MEPNKTEREEYAKEAKQLLDGTKTWRPTWQALGLNYDRSIFKAAKDSTSTSS
jgi:large subunit ribosomal protein L23